MERYAIRRQLVLQRWFLNVSDIDGQVYDILVVE
jgi:hypothetical protein